MTKEQAEIISSLQTDLVFANSPATPVAQVVGLLAEVIKQLSATMVK